MGQNPAIGRVIESRPRTPCARGAESDRVRHSDPVDLADLALHPDDETDLVWYLRTIGGEDTRDNSKAEANARRLVRIRARLDRLPHPDVTTLRARYGPDKSSGDTRGGPYAGLSSSALPLALLLLTARRLGLSRATVRAWCASPREPDAVAGLRRLRGEAMLAAEMAVLHWNRQRAPTGFPHPSRDSDEP